MNVVWSNFKKTVCSVILENNIKMVETQDILEGKKKDIQKSESNKHLK